MIFTGATLLCQGSDCVHYHGVQESTEVVVISLLGSLQNEFHRQHCVVYNLAMFDLVSFYIFPLPRFSTLQIHPCQFQSLALEQEFTHKSTSVSASKYSRSIFHKYSDMKLKFHLIFPQSARSRSLYPPKPWEMWLWDTIKTPPLPFPYGYLV